jgi:hypothetical protein
MQGRVIFAMHSPIRSPTVLKASQERRYERPSLLGLTYMVRSACWPPPKDAG